LLLSSSSSLFSSSI